jgi:hypothetical protein
MTYAVYIDKDNHWIIKVRHTINVGGCDCSSCRATSLSQYLQNTRKDAVDRIRESPITHFYPEIPVDAIVFFEIMYGRLVPACYDPVARKWSSRTAYLAKYELVRSFP